MNFRIQELDALRGLAALSVVFYHYLYRYDGLYGHPFPIPEFLKYGVFGVHLFFVISGFVIYMTITNAKRPLDFVVSRASRLYPAFWTAVILTFAVVSFFGLPGREATLSQALVNLTMIHEVLRVKHVDGVYWSLTIELTFYFWIFILFLAGKIKNIEKIGIVMMIFAGIISFMDREDQVVIGLTKIFILGHVHLFVAGIIFYKLKIGEHHPLLFFTLFLSFLMNFVLYKLTGACIVASFYLIFYLLIKDKLGFLSNRLFIFFGAISYPLYLIHQNIGYVIINKANALFGSAVLSISLALGLSIACATAITYLIEMPTLKFIRKYYSNSHSLQSLANKFTFAKS